MVQPPMTDHHPASVDITHVLLSTVFLALLAASTFWILRPFLTSILWATVVTVAAWPILTRLEAILGGRRGFAVAIMTAMILLVVFLPVALALSTIVENAQDVTAEIKSLPTIPLPAPPDWVERVPFGGQQVAIKWPR
jgi:predicted PurR-regulated permease PerM